MAIEAAGRRPLGRTGLAVTPLGFGGASIGAYVTSPGGTRTVAMFSTGFAPPPNGTLVQIALHNLLDNAWKYTGKTRAARIEIGASPNGVTEPSSSIISSL